MKKAKSLINWLICFVLVFLLVGCGCSKVKYRDYSKVKASLDEVFVLDEEDNAKEERKNKFIELLTKDTTNSFEQYRLTYINSTELSDDNKTNIKNVRDNLQQELSKLDKTANIDSIKEAVRALFDNAIQSLNALEGVVSSTPIIVEEGKQLSNTEYQNLIDKRISDSSLLLFLVERATEEVDKIVLDKDYKDYQRILFKEDRAAAKNSLAEIDTIITAEDTTLEKDYDAVLTERGQKVYDIMKETTETMQKHVSQPEPIRFKLKSFGQFFSNFFDNFLVYPIGFIILLFSRLFGGYYIVGLFIGTIVVRTIGWPIYAKTNDMSLKMKLVEPEQAKIQAKYERRKDPESQRMMQMEMARLYKKYKIGFGGCLLPFLQFPIFMAVFRAIQRFPYTNGLAGSSDWASKVNPNFLGIDLFRDRTAGTTQLIGIIILCVLVVGTQILSQIISEKRMKKQQEKAQEDIPAYRRQAVAQGNQMQSSMKMFMYMMIAMMAVFVFTSEAALGIYWLIGNLYAIAQTAIGAKDSEKRLEKLRQKHSK